MTKQKSWAARINKANQARYKNSLRYKIIKSGLDTSEMTISEIAEYFQANQDTTRSTMNRLKETHRYTWERTKKGKEGIRYPNAPRGYCRRCGKKITDGNRFFHKECHAKLWKCESLSDGMLDIEY